EQRAENRSPAEAAAQSPQAGPSISRAPPAPEARDIAIAEVAARCRESPRRSSSQTARSRAATRRVRATAGETAARSGGSGGPARGAGTAAAERPGARQPLRETRPRGARRPQEKLGTRQRRPGPVGSAAGGGFPPGRLDEPRRLSDEWIVAC